MAITNIPVIFIIKSATQYVTKSRTDFYKDIFILITKQNDAKQCRMHKSVGKEFLIVFYNKNIIKLNDKNFGCNKTLGTVNKVNRDVLLIL